MCTVRECCLEKGDEVSLPRSRHCGSDVMRESCSCRPAASPLAVEPATYEGAPGRPRGTPQERRDPSSQARRGQMRAAGSPRQYGQGLWSPPENTTVGELCHGRRRCLASTTSADPSASKEHYPKSLGQFQAWFRTDADCLDYLEWLRWPEGFVCPECGHGVGWRLRDHRFEGAGTGA